jgi:hypothetical protein
MSTPKAYLKLREKQRLESRAESKRSKEVTNSRKQEEIALYNKFSKALRPYNKQKLDGHFVTVKNAPEDRKVEVFVDGKKYLTFACEWHYSSCSCEAPCDHETYWWVTLDVTEHRKKDGSDDYGAYFGCYGEDLNNEEKFAEAMAELMDGYKYTDLSK